MEKNTFTYRAQGEGTKASQTPLSLTYAVQQQEKGKLKKKNAQTTIPPNEGHQ